MAKILLSAPTSKHKDYCMKDWIKWITASDFSRIDYDILTVDNSNDSNYYKQIVTELNKSEIKSKVIHLEAKKDRSIQQTIAESNEIIRKYFLENNYDYLFFNESDVFVPKNAIEYLSLYINDVIGLPYFIYQHYISSLINYKIMETGYNREFAIKCLEYSFFDFKGQISESYNIGLGALMISRKVLEKVDFTIDEKVDSAHSDTFFHFKLKKANIPVFQVQKHIAYHFNSSWNELGTSKSVFDKTGLTGLKINIEEEKRIYNKYIELFKNKTKVKESKNKVLLDYLEMSVKKLTPYYDVEDTYFNEKKVLTYSEKKDRLQELLGITQKIVDNIKSPNKLIKNLSLGEIDIEIYRKKKIFDVKQLESEVKKLSILSGEKQKQNIKTIKEADKILKNKVIYLKSFVDLLTRKKKLLSKYNFNKQNDFKIFLISQEIKAKREFIESYSKRISITNDTLNKG